MLQLVKECNCSSGCSSVQGVGYWQLRVPRLHIYINVVMVMKSYIFQLVLLLQLT